MDDKKILIDIESHLPPESEFNFQDYANPTNTNSASYNDGMKISPTEEKQASNKLSLWSLEYFKQFFDVDTNAVVDRVLGSMYPKPGRNYLQTYIQSKPDLYGPFWICITLVFTIAINGNIANYLQAVYNEKHETFQWKYDFHAVSVSATFIFFYAWGIPSILWTVLQYRGNEHFQLTLFELICVYGYSLAIYVPISILWVIQVSFLQWILVIFGASLSGYVLMSSIKPAFGDNNLHLVGIFFALHIIPALYFMLSFFHAT